MPMINIYGIKAQFNVSGASSIICGGAYNVESTLKIILYRNLHIKRCFLISLTDNWNCIVSVIESFNSLDSLEIYPKLSCNVTARDGLFKRIYLT